jgi:hypothetical protein
MKTKTQSILAIVLLLLSNLVWVYSASANMSLVQPAVNKVQATDPGLPSWVSEPKWVFGTIIANLFDNSAKIKAEFLTNLIPSVTTNNIPRWNGATFINSTVSSDGTSTFFNGSNRIVWDNATALTYYSNNTTSAQIPVRDSDGTLQGSLYWDTNGTNFWLLDGDGEWSYLAAKDTYTDFRINNSSIMRLLSSWNVWIWTSSPNGKLEVSWTRTNTINYTNAISNIWWGDIRIWMGALAGTPNWWTWIQSLRTSDNVPFELYINPNGWNVWIWTTSASDKLSVAGNIAATGDVKAARLCNAAGSSCVSLPITAGNIDWAWSANMVARFSDADTLSTWVIKDDGTNVGIWLGATAPAQKLDVNGYIKVRSINSEGWTIQLDWANGSTVHLENINGVFRTIDSGWTRTNFSVDQSWNGFFNGNVWVWMAASYKLDVNGNARVNNTLYFVNGIQRLYGDASSALYYNSNHSTITQQVFRDAEDTVYGRVYGDSDGVNFWLLSNDGGWQVRTWNSWVELYDSTYEATTYSNIVYDRNDTNYYIDPNGTSMTNDFRANIFYDRQDTNYYADPASISYFNDFRPNVIYDRNDTNYYVDPNGSTNLVNFRTVGSNVFNNASPTLTFQDTDHRWASIHVNSNQFYVLSANAVNGGSWTINGGYWPLQIDMNSDQATFWWNIWVPEGSVKTSCVGNCF